RPADAGLRTAQSEGRDEPLLAEPRHASRRGRSGARGPRRRRCDGRQSAGRGRHRPRARFGARRQFALGPDGAAREGLPADGRAHAARGRGQRAGRADAREGRRVLRRRGRDDDRRAHIAARTPADRRARRRHRRHGHRALPAHVLDLRPDLVRSVVKKFLKRVLALVVVGAMLAGVAGPAVAAEDDATPVQQPIASSTGLELSAGAARVGIEANGLVLGLLSGVLDPLLAGITKGLLQQIATPLVNGVASALGVSQAGSPVIGAPRSPSEFELSAGNSPSTAEDEEPASCTKTSGTCYAVSVGEGLSEIVNVLGVVSLDVGTAHGLTEPVRTAEREDIVAQAQVAGLQLGALGVDLLALDAVQSRAACTVIGSHDNVATASISNLSLLSGVVTADIAPGTGLLS